MEIVYSPKFAREYRKLPLQVQQTAEKHERLFRENPFNPKLKTHKLKGALKDFFSFSIGFKYRIIFEFGKKQVNGVLSFRRGSRHLPVT